MQILRDTKSYVETIKIKGPIIYKDITKCSKYLLVDTKKEHVVIDKYFSWNLPKGQIRNIGLSCMKNIKSVSLEFSGQSKSIWTSDVATPIINIPIFTGLQLYEYIYVAFHFGYLRFTKQNSDEPIEFDVTYESILMIGSVDIHVKLIDVIYNIGSNKYLYCTKGMINIIDDTYVIEQIKEALKNCDGADFYEELFENFYKKRSLYHRLMNKERIYNIDNTVYKEKQKTTIRGATIYYKYPEVLQQDPKLKELLVEISPFVGLTDPPALDIEVLEENSGKLVEYLKENYPGLGMQSKRYDPLEIDVEKSKVVQQKERKIIVDALLVINSASKNDEVVKSYTHEQVKNDEELVKIFDENFQKN